MTKVIHELLTLSGLHKAAGFARDTKANVVMIFALALLPIFIVIGFAIDNNRHVTYQQKLQTALDFAALATARQAREEDLNDAEMTVVAQRFFNSQFEFSPDVSLNPLAARAVGNEVELTATGTLDTSMMMLIGQPTMPLGSVSAVVYDIQTPVELTLVLDTSGSMSGSKLTALKSAAKSLVDVLLPSTIPANNGPVKVSVVPFARYVNVGTDKRLESWIDVEPDRDQPRTSCSITTESYEDAGCERESYSCTRWRGSIENGDRESYEGTCWRWDCPSGADPVEVCTPWTREWRWYGCVESRDNPLNIKDEDYLTDPVVGFVTTNGNLCPAPIQELTNSQQKSYDAIDALTARNDTYIATGLTWGLRTLSSNAPFSEGEDYTTFAADEGRKALVLMSDGANTRSPSSNGKHNSTDEDNANSITLEVCTEIKSKGIELYTIAFELDDVDTKAMLETCATDTDSYYDADNAAELQVAFDDIARDLTELAISR